MALVAAGFDDSGEHIVCKLDATYIEPLLDAQQSTIDKSGEGIRRTACGLKAPDETFLGHILAEAGFSEQIVLNDSPHSRRLVSQCPLVEVGQDSRVRPGQQVEGDLAAALSDATTQFELDKLEPLLETLLEIHQIVRKTEDGMKIPHQSHFE